MIYDIEDDLQYLQTLLAEILIYCNLDVDNINSYSLDYIKEALNNLSDPDFVDPYIYRNFKGIYCNYHMVKNIYEEING